jgi:ubiquinone/menaquinone biosynthesis C-methylase UbiE
MNYESETLHAYQTVERARQYHRHHTTAWSWARFMTGLEHRAVRRELRRYPWTVESQLLDIPGGTGILGRLLRDFPFWVTASDISAEMLAIARTEYPAGRLRDCVVADITRTPFPAAAFDCIVTLGFLHRVPPAVKTDTLRELSRLARRVVIVSCAVDTPAQRFKKALLRIVKPGHVPAPCPATLPQLVQECEAQGFRVRRTVMVLPLISAHAILVLEK